MMLAQGRVEGFAPAPGVGINAEVAYMAMCLGVEGVDVAGVTGTAFRTHFFTPEVNLGMEDPPAWTWSSLRHNNYGHHEATAYYYGGDVIPVTDRNAVQNWKLLRFEIDAGRPATVFGLDPNPARPVLVTGYDLYKAPLRQVLLLADGVEVDVTGAALGDVEIILVRRGPRVPYRPTDEERRTDMFRWVVRHVRGEKELVYETSRFYATGASALRYAAGFVRSAQEADAYAFAVTFVSECVQARQLAAEFAGQHLGVEVGHAVSAELAELVAAASALEGRGFEVAAGHLELAASASLKWADLVETA